MKDVLQEIVPSKEQEKQFYATINLFINKLNKNLKNAKSLVGGSAAKGTWLAKDHDVDIFVQYTKHEDLSDQLQKTLKRAFPKLTISRLHGSRDYFQLTFKEINFEVVPVVKISKASDAHNITDVSVLHAKWTKKHVQTLINDIRLAKQFFKANRLYGAESHIGGFSGHIIEILIIKYGSFKGLLKASTKWKPKTVIDVANLYKGKDVFFEMNTSKLHSPIIIVDPVDKTRNAAAALTIDKVKLLQKIAKAYLKNPSRNFFFKQEYTKDFVATKAKKNPYIYVKAFPKQGKRDVIGMKLAKSFSHILKELKEFEIIEAKWDWDIMYCIVKTKSIEAIAIRKGPPLSMKQAVANFKKKNKDTYTKNKHIYAKILRKKTSLTDVASHAIKHEYVKERVNKIELSFS